MLKRISTLLIASVTLLPMLLNGCGKNTNKTAGDTTTPEVQVTTPEITTQKQSAIPEDATFKTWMSEGFNKVYGEARLPAELPTTFSLQAAKNEKESCHVSFRINTEVKGLTFKKIEGEVENIGVEILEEYLVPTGSKHFPDPIAPFDGSFDVQKNMNKSLLIRFATNKDTKAGDYVYKFELADSNGVAIQEYTVNLKVWNITLPDELGCDTAGDIRENEVQLKEKISMVMLKKSMYKEYYDMLIDYNFSAHDLPYDILDERADEYMSNPRVTGFRVDYNFSDEKLIAINEKLKSNPVWLEKAYFYIYDEPNDIAALNVLAERVERLNEICPDIDVLVAFFRNVKYDDSRDQIDFMSEYCDVFCAKSAAWGQNWLSDPLGRGYFGDRMDALKAEGNKIWWYVCWEPVYPYCNVQVNELGIYHRQLFWQQYMYKSDGFLYWSVTYWPETENPWEDMATVKSLSDTCFGDGSLMYPGYPMGIDGPVASIRLECIRDGIEDFDLLKLAEQYLGREWVVAKINEVTKSITQPSKDNELFAEVRKSIGDALEAELNK